MTGQTVKISFIENDVTGGVLNVAFSERNLQIR